MYNIYNVQYLIFTIYLQYFTIHNIYTTQYLQVAQAAESARAAELRAQAARHDALELAARRDARAQCHKLVRFWVSSSLWTLSKSPPKSTSLPE